MKKTALIISFFVFIALIIGFNIAYYSAVYPLKYKNYISTYAGEYGLDKTLVCSVINAESGFNKDAKSSKGAVGLMQIMPQTAVFIANELGEEYDYEKLYDPQTNIRYGCFYLNYLRERFVDETVYLASYNAGETAVNLWLGNNSYSRDGVTLDKIPYDVTRAYTNKILNGKKYYNGRI